VDFDPSLPETSNSKLQNPRKVQKPNFKPARRRNRLEFAAWSSLDFGEWILILPFLKLQIPNSKESSKAKLQTSPRTQPVGVCCLEFPWILVSGF
jgi:hypothetical protein